MKSVVAQLLLVVGMAVTVSTDYLHAEVTLLPTLPLPLEQLQLPVRVIPEFDLGDCVAKVSAGCRASGYPQCTEWSMAVCRDTLPPKFPSCFAAVEESCRLDGLPNCPNYALTQCKQ